MFWFEAFVSAAPHGVLLWFSFIALCSHPNTQTRSKTSFWNKEQLHAVFPLSCSLIFNDAVGVLVPSVSDTASGSSVGFWGFVLDSYVPP